METGFAERESGNWFQKNWRTRLNFGLCSAVLMFRLGCFAEAKARFR